MGPNLLLLLQDTKCSPYNYGKGMDGAGLGRALHSLCPLLNSLDTGSLATDATTAVLLGLSGAVGGALPLRTLHAMHSFQADHVLTLCIRVQELHLHPFMPRVTNYCLWSPLSMLAQLQELHMPAEYVELLAWAPPSLRRLCLLSYLSRKESSCMRGRGLLAGCPLLQQVDVSRVDLCGPDAASLFGDLSACLAESPAMHMAIQGIGMHRMTEEYNAENEIDVQPDTLPFFFWLSQLSTHFGEGGGLSSVATNQLRSIKFVQLTFQSGEISKLMSIFPCIEGASPQLYICLPALAPLRCSMLAHVCSLTGKHFGRKTKQLIFPTLALCICRCDLYQLHA